MNTKSILAFSAIAVAFALIASPLLAAMDASAYSSSSSKVIQKQYASQKCFNCLGNFLVQSQINFAGNTR